MIMIISYTYPYDSKITLNELGVSTNSYNTLLTAGIQVIVNLWGTRVRLFCHRHGQGTAVCKSIKLIIMAIL